MNTAKKSKEQKHTTKYKRLFDKAMTKNDQQLRIRTDKKPFSPLKVRLHLLQKNIRRNAGGGAGVK